MGFKNGFCLEMVAKLEVVFPKKQKLRFKKRRKRRTKKFARTTHKEYR